MHTSAQAVITILFIKVIIIIFFVIVLHICNGGVLRNREERRRMIYCLGKLIISKFRVQAVVQKIFKDAVGQEAGQVWLFGRWSTSDEV